MEKKFLLHESTNFRFVNLIPGPSPLGEVRAARESKSSPKISFHFPSPFGEGAEGG